MRRVVVGFMVLMVSVGCHRNASTGRSQLLLMSTNDTIALGEESQPALIEEYGGVVPSHEVSSYVEMVGRSMAELTEAKYPALPWEFTVVNSDAINAFALPGGKVFATRGLLVRLQNEAQLAGVLGHEIGHVTAEHVNERISQQLIVQGLVIGSAAAASSSDSDWAVAVPIVVGVAGQGYLLSFSRRQESEADNQGVKYMTAAGYDPEAMLEVLDVLRTASSGSRQPEFLSTHPYPETRIQTVSKLLAGPYAYTQGNPDYRKYPERYREDALQYLPAPDAGLAAAGVLDAPMWCGICRARLAALEGSTAQPAECRPPS